MAYFPALFGGGDGKPNAPDEISIANYVGYFFYFIPLLLARPSIVSAGKSFPLTPRNTPKSPSSSSSPWSSPSWSRSSSISPIWRVHVTGDTHAVCGCRPPIIRKASRTQRPCEKRPPPPHTRLKASEITRTITPTISAFLRYSKIINACNVTGVRRTAANIILPLSHTCIG